jgi:hypothetical protein
MAGLQGRAFGSNLLQIGSRLWGRTKDRVQRAVPESFGHTRRCSVVGPPRTNIPVAVDAESQFDSNILAMTVVAAVATAGAVVTTEGVAETASVPVVGSFRRSFSAPECPLTTAFLAGLPPPY